MTHYRKMTWAVVLGKAVILPVLTSDWLFKALFQSYVSSLLQLSYARLKQDRLYLETHSKMNHIYLTKDQKFSILSGHSQSIQLDKSYSITSNTVVIKSSRIFTRSAYKCTKCLLGFAMPVLQEIPVRQYCSTQFILSPMTTISSIRFISLVAVWVARWCSLVS